MIGLNACDFSFLAELACDRAWQFACPTINGESFYDPATRADAQRAAREFETAAILWSNVCPRSAAECLIQARSYGEGPTLEDHGLL
jgi:hypothetical protein